jgi:dihydrofolate reductase
MPRDLPTIRIFTKTYKRENQAVMGKLFWQINSSLDGFMEGLDRYLTYTAQVADPEFERYASDMLRSIDAFVIGRKTYEVFVDYWPTAKGPDADTLNELPKLVVSRTLTSTNWKNSRLVTENLFDEIESLKKNSERDVALFGSAGLATSLMELGLIDEIRIFVTPFILGAGTRTFDSLKAQTDLKLEKAETWPSGTVALTYLKP